MAKDFAFTVTLADVINAVNNTGEELTDSKMEKLAKQFLKEENHWQDLSDFILEKLDEMVADFVNEKIN